jgi:hypothetical protein
MPGRSEPSTWTLNFTKQSNRGAFWYRRRSNTSVGDFPSVRDSNSPNQPNGRRMRACFTLAEGLAARGKILDHTLVKV